MERTTTIRASLRDAGRTLAFSVALVVLVVFLFLRHGRATLIPSVAVPVSLTVTFGVMYLFGYSLDNLSLMALTIATGFVVDDAIVVLENVSRHIEAGMPPMEAARVGAGEVGFTVLAMTLSLVAVFIPLLLMGGFVGRFFREFAVTLSAAILVSLVVSLTTTPMMCSRLLLPAGERRTGRFHRVERARVRRRCSRLTGARSRWALDHAPLTVLMLLATVALNVFLYVIVPKGFFPQQDTGQLIGRIQADQSISFQAMRQKLADFIAIVRADPAVANVVGFTGGAAAQHGLDVRHAEAAVRARGQRRPDRRAAAPRARARARRQSLPARRCRISASAAGRATRPTSTRSRPTTSPTSRRGSRASALALSQLPELVDVNTDQQNKGLSTSLVIDRDAAARLGVTPRTIDATLNDAFAQRQVSTIYSPRNQYYVVMEAAPEYWQSAGCAQPDARQRAGRRAGAAVDVRAAYGDRDLARGQSPVAVRRFHHFVQPRRKACRCRRRPQAIDARARPHRRADDGARQLPGIRARVPGRARDPAHADPRGAPDALHRAGRAVRELRSSAHDPVDAALGRRRRAASR